MGVLDFKTLEINRILDGRLHSPIQDCVGDNTAFAMTAGVEYDFECNCATRDEKILPSHITNMWDGVNNVATFSEFDNTPMIVSTVSFYFAPSAASPGKMTISAYVNEDTPLLIESVTVNFKAVAERTSALLTYYAGDDTGFDVKNKGVIFKVESDTDGTFSQPAILTYRT